jgi:hypothetical protein
VFVPKNATEAYHNELERSLKPYFMKGSPALQHLKLVIVTRGLAKSTAISIGYPGVSAPVAVVLAFNIKTLSFTSRQQMEVPFALHEEIKSVMCNPVQLIVRSRHGAIGPLVPQLVEAG